MLRKFFFYNFLSCSAFYNLPNVLSTRSTTFGYGTKYDFTKANKDKNAPYYEHQSDFDPKKYQHPAYTFGIARQYYEKVYCEASTFGDKAIPGPGNYNVLKSFGSDTFKYSLYGKGKNLSNKNKVPGPGEYPIVSINPRGRYPLSKMKNATGIVWSSSKAKRFNYSSKKFFLTFLRKSKSRTRTI